MLSPWTKIFSKYFSILKRNCPPSAPGADLHKKVADHTLRYMPNSVTKVEGEKLQDPMCYDWKQMPSSESEHQILKLNITLFFGRRNLLFVTHIASLSMILNPTLPFVGVTPLITTLF